ncbi:hypothetical protein [Peribacillus sp. NJ4]|uniref:hypothetical protein n=1 Tax=Peribacillus sp. NJ4 TaxID=3055862 RepID=UPI0025A03472|nr:hypothetical protein [Peribacillus sp. NJ4]
MDIIYIQKIRESLNNHHRYPGHFNWYFGDNISISKEGTEKSKKEIDDLMDELFED